MTICQMDYVRCKARGVGVVLDVITLECVRGHPQRFFKVRFESGETHYVPFSGRRSCLQLLDDSWKEHARRQWKSILRNFRVTPLSSQQKMRPNYSRYQQIIAGNNLEKLIGMICELKQICKHPDFNYLRNYQLLQTAQNRFAALLAAAHDVICRGFLFAEAKRRTDRLLQDIAA